MWHGILGVPVRGSCALALAVCFAGLTGAGCEKSANCQASLGDAGVAAPCQNGGSGQCFDQPQVCPSKGILLFCERKINSSNRWAVELQNVGQKPLTITSIKSHGDTACAFIDPQLRDPDGGVPMTIESQESVILSFRFVPPSTGAFQGSIEIDSNAENFPQLFIPVCGKGVPEDAPPAPIDDAGVQRCDPPECEDVHEAAVVNCWGGFGVGPET